MIGTTLSHYTIDAKVGEGGMGTVYRARDTVLGRVVAIKVLSADAANDAELGPRILREAKAASKLNHPNIVTLYELGRSGETGFLVMEYVDGASLGAQIAPGGLPIDRVIDYAWQIADALAAAHEAGLVHRDMKPGNVMITPSRRVKVLDFGLARQLPVAAAAETRAATTEFMTREGMSGTVGYMAPEQIEGRPADARSDVFALGVVIFEMLTGRRPFAGDTAWRTMQATVDADPPPVSELRPDTSPALVRIVARALAKRPEDRYPTARALADDLAALRTPTATMAAPVRKRGWATIAAVSSLALAAAGTIGWIWIRESRMRWVRVTALPEIERLVAEGDIDGGFRLAQQARAIAPDDPQVRQVWNNVAFAASIGTDPQGAEVAVKGYGSTRDWMLVGTTPLKDVQVPLGPVRWRVTKAGYDQIEVSSEPGTLREFRLVPSGTAPPGMLFVPHGPVELDTGAVDVPDYWIDTYEV
ncbi:MAG: serine/threonine-protein kinase, partial [Acidobacteriota bacterium]